VPATCVHAQLLQRSQAADTRWEAAGELITVEIAVIERPQRHAKTKRSSADAQLS
jgi:hypothetical protein